jgi:hypothetical protein
MLDYQRKGCGPRGADMGRRSDLETSTTGCLTIRRVPLDNGGYDPGGAYWGTPNDLFHVTDGERDFYDRAKSLDEVKALFPHATWAEEPAEASEEDLADMVLAYIEAALWSTNDESTPEGGVPLDDNYSEADLSDECRREMTKDCERFAKENAATIRTVIGARAPRGRIDWSTVGHDFWLTRNGHGCGFWDGDYPKEEGEALTKASKGFGEVYLYVEDGKIHQDG